MGNTNRQKVAIERSEKQSASQRLKKKKGDIGDRKMSSGGWGNFTSSQEAGDLRDQQQASAQRSREWDDVQGSDFEAGGWEIKQQVSATQKDKGRRHAHQAGTARESNGWDEKPVENVHVSSSGKGKEAKGQEGWAQVAKKGSHVNYLPHHFPVSTSSQAPDQLPIMDSGANIRGNSTKAQVTDGDMNVSRQSSGIGRVTEEHPFSDHWISPGARVTMVTGEYLDSLGEYECQKKDVYHSHVDNGVERKNKRVPDDDFW